MPVSSELPATHISLRSPSAREAELVMTAKGRTTVYKLTFDQLRLLTIQSAEAINRWPVQEVPAEGLWHEDDGA